MGCTGYPIKIGVYILCMDVCALCTLCNLACRPMCMCIYSCVINQCVCILFIIQLFTLNFYSGVTHDQRGKKLDLMYDQKKINFRSLLFQDLGIFLNSQMPNELPPVSANICYVCHVHLISEWCKQYPHLQRACSYMFLVNVPRK